jgi:energy-coupling factor transport system permease protein
VQNTDAAIQQEASGTFVENKRMNFMEGRTKGLQDIDPRMKIIISLAFSTMLFLTAQKITIFVSLIATFAILLLSGKGKNGVKLLVAYTFFASIDFLTAFAGPESVRVLLGVFLYSFMKFIPVLMLGSWIVATIKVNEFMAAMEKMRLPKNVIIPLAVLLRFLPTIKEELGYIKDTMKMRNIELSFSGILFHPIKTMEYILVPLLMRSVKVADELSAAALTRGIDGENKRTSLREVRILFSDAVSAFLFIGLAAVLWYLDKTVFDSLVIGRILA